MPAVMNFLGIDKMDHTDMDSYDEDSYDYDNDDFPSIWTTPFD
jgi:hypothetical protein